MQCAQCDTELIPGKRFCHACGAPVTATCASCGATIDPTFRFCPDCGARVGVEAPRTPDVQSAPLADASPPAANARLAELARHIPEGLAEKIRASTGAISGERKLVTVLFCDLVGSTAIAERLDPEEYHDLLEQYLELALREIYRFEGIVNQLAGDGMMALFGAPIAHEDAPERALRAALAIRAALEEFNRQEQSNNHGLQLRARVGIHTGPVVVGTVGNDLKMDYTAIGDTTNLAARLESVATPGTILASEATYRLVRGLFQMRTVGPLEVKGKSEPITAYEVLDISANATPIEIAAERGLTPLVGRNEELSQLQACFARLGGGLAQVVAVVGQAGSGKSRLLYEFKQQLAADAAVFFEARCSSLSQMQPYAPWINMMRQYFELIPGEPAGCACEKVARKLQRWDAKLEELYPYLCRVLSVPVQGLDDVPADELKRATFMAVAHVVVDATQRAPVVMIIEDLQWIDASSREMLELAVAELRGERVMLLASHRPDYQPAWQTGAAFTQLNLHPLSDADTIAIIHAVAGASLPSELEQRILLKAEGNPFVTEEITRALVEEGHLVRSNGDLKLTRPAAEIRMPDTVQELVGARLDRLGAPAKRVVQVAAVLGRQFHRDQLAQLLAGDGINVPAILDELERRGVIHRKNLLSKDEFRFGESLTQEVAYETLLLRERRQLHERIGLLLETNGGEGRGEQAALLAHHFARSENRRKAIESLVHAARAAEQLPSFGAAVGFYRQAWELADAALDAPEVDDQLRRWALDAASGLCRVIVLYDSPDLGDFERAAQRGRELAETLGDAGTLAGLFTFQGMMMSDDRERFTQGLALIEEGLAVARNAGLEVSAISITRALAWSYMLDGRFELMQRTFDWLISELEEREHGGRPSDLYISARWMRETARYFTDDLEAILPGLVETYDLAVRAPNRTAQSITAATRALIHIVRGEYGDAQQWAQRSLEVAQAIGNVGALRTATVLLLTTRVERGESATVARDAEIIEEGLSFGGNLLLYVGLITETFLALGDLERAERFARLAHARAAGRLREMLTAVALGDVMLRLGPSRWEEAQHWYEKGIDLAEVLGVRAALAQALLGAGELAAARGDRDTGVRHLQHALALFRDLELGRYQARAERLLAAAQAGVEQGNRPSA